MRFADPLAQAEVDRLTAKLAVLEAGEPLVSEALRDEIRRLADRLDQIRVIWENDDGHAIYCESPTTGRGRDCNCWRATIGAILEETE